MRWWTGSEWPWWRWGESHPRPVRLRQILVHKRGPLKEACAPVERTRRRGGCRRHVAGRGLRACGQAREMTLASAASGRAAGERVLKRKDYARTGTAEGANALAIADFTPETTLAVVVYGRVSRARPARLANVGKDVRQFSASPYWAQGFGASRCRGLAFRARRTG